MTLSAEHFSNFAYRCEGVSFAYARGVPVLTDFSHVFPRGITLLRGYSGCGKTTLLKLLGGFLKPDAGALVPPVPEATFSRRFRRLRVGYMFQDLNLLPLLSLEKNLELCGEISLIPKKFCGNARKRCCAGSGSKNSAGRARTRFPADNPNGRRSPARC